MMSIESLANKIGKKSTNVLNSNEDQEEVIVYGAILVLNTLISISSVMVFGFIFGVFYEALLFSTVASILRKYSGGVHASSPSRCAIFGAITAVLMGLAIDKLFYKIEIITVLILIIISLIGSFIIIYKNAPVDSIKKPITDIKEKRNFKKNSMIVILIDSILIIIFFVFNINNPEVYYIKAIECISLGILYQSITLTKIGIRSHDKVDFVLKYIMEGDGKNEK